MKCAFNFCRSVVDDLNIPNTKLDGAEYRIDINDDQKMQAMFSLCILELCVVAASFIEIAL